MKGFVYMIEIATAAIIMTVILSMFFSIRIKQDWGSADLAAIGANMLNVIRNDPGAINELLMENYTLLDANRPQNAKYGLSVIGAPKSNLTVACVNYCNYISETLPSAYVNGRWINFTVVPFDNDTYGYDAIVIVNYTSYSTLKPYIDSYLSRGGVVMGINDTFSSSSTDFNNIFGLSAGSGSSSTVNFTSYSPSQDEISKIFLGIGMNVGTQWRIWNDVWTVSYSSGLVTLTNSSTTISNKAEGSTFSLTGPNGQSYMFKIKKVWGNSMANIQPLNKSFVFRDFSDSQKMTGSRIVGSSNFAVLTKNNSALWMSSFPSGNDYSSLMQAALLSRLTDWTAKYDITGRETTTVSSFVPLCCDMPETAELFITLWYEV